MTIVDVASCTAYTRGIELPDLVTVEVEDVAQIPQQVNRQSYSLPACRRFLFPRITIATVITVAISVVTVGNIAHIAVLSVVTIRAATADHESRQKVLQLVE